MEDYNNIIEGILYLKGDEGIDIKELSLILEISKKEAVEAMDHFIEAYSKRGFDGLQVVDFGGKYKLATNPQYFPYYQKMVEQSKTTLSQAALETLAIIAYNQPITRAKVEDIRAAASPSRAGAAPQTSPPRTSAAGSRQGRSPPAPARSPCARSARRA